MISIHALREEGDTAQGQIFSTYTISIHALREEGDPFSRRTPGNNTRFLSTPSARRATTDLSKVPTTQEDFYPRPPRGGRRATLTAPGISSAISIHALREEGDARNLGAAFALCISIHALREEGDAVRLK